MIEPPVSPDLPEATAVRRRDIILKALAVGVVSGLLASAFRLGLDKVEHWRIDSAAALPHGSAGAFLVAVGAAGALIAAWLVRRFAPHAVGSGIPHLQAVLAGEIRPEWKRLIPVKFFSGVLALGSGLTLGREGPTVQMGGAVGALVGDLMHVRPGEGERRALMSAGAGAGLAAAFNAPLSGLIFVLEELHGRFTPVMFVAAFLASVAADVVSRVLVTGLPTFHVEGMTPPGIDSLPLAAVLGILAGVFGVVFNRGLLGVLALRERLAAVPWWIFAGGTGALIGLVRFASPVLGLPGTMLLQQAISGHVAAQVVGFVLVARFGMVLASYQTGVSGGIFAPLLVLGSLGGLWLGAVAPAILKGSPEPAQVFCVLGMGALFTACVRAPLTGIVLMIEMTGEYGFMLPLLTSCLLAYGVAEALGNAPIYQALRARSSLPAVKPAAATPTA